MSFDRDAVLREAMLAFWRHGYETTSIADLTAAMGITPPSLYSAFGSKEQLFLEALRLYVGDPTRIKQAIDDAPTSRQAAQRMLTAAATAFTGETTPPGCLLASATASGSSASAAVRRLAAKVRRDIVSWLCARIDRDVATGDLPPTTSSSALANLVMTVTQGMSVLARDGEPREALLAVAEMALRGWPRERAGGRKPQTS